MPEPKRLKLLKVSAEGYLVGPHLGGKGYHVLVSHEVMVAVLTGLIENEDRQDEAFNHELQEESWAVQALKDAASTMRRILGSIAWRLGVCSWDNKHRAIPRDAIPFHSSD